VSVANSTTPRSAGAGSPTDTRLSVLLWLAWRILPPLDRSDLRILTRVGGACAYLAMPLTVGLAAGRLPPVTSVSLLCLAVPGLPMLWRNAIRLGERRRGTALALRQAGLGAGAAAVTSLSRQVAYPAFGAVLGVALSLLLRGTLRSALPDASPLAVAIKEASGSWPYATLPAVVALVGLTTVLGSENSRDLAHRVKRTMTRFDRPAAEPQPQ
jgi:hypothetical protein